MHLVCLVMLLGAAEQQPPAADAPEKVTEPSQEQTVKPPPSAWDRYLQEKATREGRGEVEPEEGISWGTQLVKTVVALLLVVALIYLLFKVGLARFIGVAATIRGNKTMKVVERVQLDARHALVIIELEGEKRLLLGTGERGVQLIADLNENGKATPKSGTNFQATMESTATKESGSSDA